MKKLELRDANRNIEDLMNLGCGREEIMEAWETSRTAEEFLKKANSLPLFRPLALSLDTQSFVSFIMVDCFGNRHILKAYKG